jgi:hypothetical protein
VSDALGAKWVSCFVRCTAGSAFQGWVGAGVAGSTSGDHTKVVLHAVVLGTDGAGGFLCFTEYGVVAITLTVMAVRVRGPREVWCDAAFSVAESKCGCAKVFEFDRAQESDNKSGCLFVGAAICWDKPAGCLRKVQGGVEEFHLFLDY